MTIRSTISLLVALLFVSCVAPPERRGADDDDATEPPSEGQVDILFVVDNSNSMAAIQQELQGEFPSLLASLAAGGVQFQLGVTTTDLDSGGNGNQGSLRSLEAVGAGTTCGEPRILTPDDADLAGDFEQLLDVGVVGSGNEKGLYAAAVALCKAQGEAFWAGLDALPDDDPVKGVCSMVPVAERACNGGFLRDGASLVVAIFTDEGDDTERLEFLPPPSHVEQCVLDNNDDPFFGECDCRLAWWMEFFEGVAPGAAFLTVGPTYQSAADETSWCDGGTVSIPGPCNPFGNTICSIDFYQRAACLSGGAFFPYATTDGADPTCSTVDFGDVAQGLAGLVQPL